jgi:hypothetical protein
VCSRVQISDAVTAVLRKAEADKAKYGAVLPHLGKSFGTGVGLTVSEPSLDLTVDNRNVIQYVPVLARCGLLAFPVLCGSRRVSP